MITKTKAVALTAIGLIAACGNAWAEACCDPASPFVLGEAFPETPATCETVGDWVNRAPQIDARISFTIVGPVAEVHFDGALAYLIMCEPAGVQVMCVTYSTNDLEPGDTVMLAGGYSRVGEKQVMLDPCLPYDAP